MLNADFYYRTETLVGLAWRSIPSPAVDAKIVDNAGWWWLTDAFRGH